MSPSSGEMSSAGAMLVDLASRDSHRGRRGIFDEERVMFEECFARGQGDPRFTAYHVEAVRQAVKALNYERGEILLSKDYTHKLLCAHPDILHIALRIEDHATARDETIPLKMLPLLIKHGAQVNAVASSGVTALYLTCDNGFKESFRFLIEAGADCTTLHRPRPPQQLDDEAMSEAVEAKPELNLLQVALRARLENEGRGSANSGYYTPLEEQWATIIEHLFAAGLKTANDDPSLVKFLHVACHQGRVKYVESVLRHGVDVHAKAARVDDRDTVYGSALHAAAAGGHRDIVLRLLQYGADPRTARLQQYMKPYHDDEILTPIAAGLQTGAYEYRLGSRPDEVLDACESILAAGADQADRKLLIKHSAVNGDVERVRRLLQPGVVIDQVPLCFSIDVIRLFLDHGAAIDAGEFQKYAIREGQLSLMRFLVARFGPLLEASEGLRDLVIDVRQNRKDTRVLEYLVSDYGHATPLTHSIHGEVATALFDTICQRLGPTAVQSLLRDAGKSCCPGVHAAALRTLECMLHNYFHDKYNINDRLTKEQVLLYQLLLTYGQQAGEFEHIHHDKLWLTPDKVPQHIWDHVLFMQPKQSDTLTFPPDDAISNSDALLEDDTDALGEGEDHDITDSEVPTPPEQEIVVQREVVYPSDEKNSREAIHLPALSLNDCPDAENKEHIGENADREKHDHASAGSIGFTPDLKGTAQLTYASTSASEPAEHTVTAHCSLCAKNNRFKYDQLDGYYAIRLMIIEPSRDADASLECQLLSTDLGQHPPYEALSYVWGDLEDTIEISLQGIGFVVTKNLGTALRRLRLPDKERKLWVDAICINQNFISERNQQVRIMREIYQRAQQVLIWVGDEGDGSHLIFEHIKGWKTYRDDYKAGRTRRNNPWGEAHLNMPHYTGLAQQAFEKFCRRPYFFRTWVIQEVAVSKGAVVICGRDQEELDMIARGTAFRMGNIYDPFRGVDVITHFHELRGLGQSTNLKTILQYSRFCNASDPRDRVYGLLGLFLRPLITVDYEFDVRTVFQNFTEAIINEEGDLQFYSWFGVSSGHVGGLPSWVPDYTAADPSGILPRVFHHTYGVTAASNSLRKVLPGMRFDGSRVHLKGSHLDTVLHIGSVLSVYPSNIPDSPSFRSTIHEWEEIAARVAERKRYRRPVAEMFLKTLTAGQSASIMWYNKLGSGTLRNLEEDYFTDFDVLRAWQRRSESSGSSKDEIEFGHFARELNETCYGRRFFVTEKGSMGLAPPGAEEGDMVVFFSGALYPFVLRCLGDGSFAIMGDCYLYEPRENGAGKCEDFNEHEFYADDIYRDVTEWIIR
ncbi:hypothetical protein, variant [Exophiala xenobiotica]|uniref:Heterokaryon incompatibility domain-containing protein n=1 Tax=Exophiala xenobiotica TaxID=348802 RepID=A0A0D2D4D4_9EURO|nr:hypothetical protein, variant [Exophiala xenobiotica]KIW57222.1 hypothetical protein, variant [Exophiala xenobiotica]